MGGWDKGDTPWRRISQSEILKSAATEKEAVKAREGKNLGGSESKINNFKFFFGGKQS